MDQDQRHHVVIVGGGFGGLYAAQSLRRAPVRVTLIDRRNFHLFQPLLYQVASGGLSPADIASPLRSLLKRQSNARVIQGEVTGFDVQNRQVVVDEDRIQYDTLIVAAGARHHYFGQDQWEPLAPGLKTIEEALEIRRRIFNAFEQAERTTDAELRNELMTFVVVGGGPTGVELAGAIGELAHHTLRRDFRAIDTTQTKVFLLEAGGRILSTYPESLSQQAAGSLERLGVTVWTDALVTNVQPQQVTIQRQEQELSVRTQVVMWAAGVSASPLAKALAEAAHAETDRQGRVIVDADLSLAGHPEILVLGDMAHVGGPHGAPLPGTAPVAMQQGRYAADLIRRRIRNKPVRPFRYKDRGNMAVIGRSAAVAQIGRLRLHGFPAWLVWLFVHLINLVEFQNRLLVLVQWGWNYLTRNRSARLITRTFDRFSR